MKDSRLPSLPESTSTFTLKVGGLQSIFYPSHKVRLPFQTRFRTSYFPVAYKPLAPYKGPRSLDSRGEPR